MAQHDSEFIAQQLARYPDLISRMSSIITAQRAFTVFKQVADCYAPSLTVRYTRGPVIAALMSAAQEEGNAGPFVFHRNYLSTGNVGLELGSEQRKPAWAMAHLDIISFLTGEYRDGRYELTPFCSIRNGPGAREALALVFDAEHGEMRPAATGKLIIEEGDRRSLFFATEQDDLLPGTRVVYATDAEWDEASGIVYGCVDNAASCVSLLLAAMVLSLYEAEALLLLTDEEEGPVTLGNQAFSRGSARLLHRVTPDQLPNLITVSDIHEDIVDLAQGTLNVERFEQQAGKGAVFGSHAFHAAGGVTPPSLMHFQHELSRYLQGHGIRLRSNSGFISRSDCVSAMMATQHIALLGFPGAFSHFADTPRAHIDDIVDLAKVLVVYLLLAQSPAWRERYLF